MCVCWSIVGQFNQWIHLFLKRWKYQYMLCHFTETELWDVKYFRHIDEYRISGHGWGKERETICVSVSYRGNSIVEKRNVRSYIARMFENFRAVVYIFLFERYRGNCWNYLIGVWGRGHPTTFFVCKIELHHSLLFPEKCLCCRLNWCSMPSKCGLH